MNLYFNSVTSGLWRKFGKILRHSKRYVHLVTSFNNKLFKAIYIKSYKVIYTFSIKIIFSWKKKIIINHLELQIVIYWPEFCNFSSFRLRVYWCIYLVGDQVDDLRIKLMMHEMMLCFMIKCIFQIYIDNGIFQVLYK